MDKIISKLLSYNTISKLIWQGQCSKIKMYRKCYTNHNFKPQILLTHKYGKKNHLEI